MNVELVTIGTELLLGFTVDTNAAEIGRLFAEHGIQLVRHTTVADDAEQIQAVVGEALDRTGVVLTTGGLGPTRDDISREVIADLLAMPLAFDATLWAGLEDRYRQLGRDLPETNRPQAMVPHGATIVANRWGTAPGLWLEHSRGVVVMLPGVPNEMRRMLSAQVIPMLLARPGEKIATVTRSRTLRTAGISESALAGRIGPIEASLAPLTLAYLPQTAGVDLRLTAWGMGPVAADRLLNSAVATLARLTTGNCYGQGDEELAGNLIGLLRDRALHLAVAESCTGGMLGSQLTAIAGSSDVFIGGVVAYADQVKEALLDVPAVLLSQHGAVSAAVAEAMAQGVARRLGAEVGVAITGIAGPGGGSPEKPVGTVFLGFALGGVSDAVRIGLPGGRQEIRERAVAAALMGLRKRLLEG